MKACGVEIKSNEAIICIMSKENDLYDIPHTRVQKVSLDNAGDAEQVQKFQFTFAKLMEDYQVTHVIIRGRALKGKFAGGPIGFKVEAAIQLIKELQVEILAGSFIKKELAKSQIDIDFRDTGLKQYQEQAFETVFAYLEGIKQCSYHNIMVTFVIKLNENNSIKSIIIGCYLQELL